MGQKTIAQLGFYRDNVNRKLVIVDELIFELSYKSRHALIGCSRTDLRAVIRTLDCVDETRVSHLKTTQVEINLALNP